MGNSSVFVPVDNVTVMHHLKEVRLLRTSSCIKRKGKWVALFEGAQIESSSEPAGSMTDQTLDGYLSKHTQLSFGSVYTQKHSGSDYGTPTPLPGLE